MNAVTPINFSEEAIDAAIRAWFGITKVGREEPIIRTRMNAALQVACLMTVPLTAAMSDVIAERARQISDEGWTPEHDDQHQSGQLSDAAACYALGASHWPHEVFDLFWPWDREWWRPQDARRNLVKACALAIAEIERLDRAATPSAAVRSATA